MKNREAIAIEVYVNDVGKRVEIWLSHSEQSDDEVTELVDEICGNYSERKYRAAVFISGECSLEECTEYLLCSNL